jgi:cyclopropane fatty-acyl-phospholipid synthase-like methyltransferase
MSLMQDSGSSLPHSDACERNKGAILAVLRAALSESGSVLEVGSGTGQHVVHFARELPHTRWLPTDTGAYLPGLQARLRVEAPANVTPAIELDVRMDAWAVPVVDAVFSANTLHFMSVECVREFFRGVHQVLSPSGLLIVYGPFNYGGEFSSPSNARFDAWLKETDPVRGIREFEWLNELAEARGLSLREDLLMPANNRALVWGRGTNM